MFFELVSEIGLQRKTISDRKSRNKSLKFVYFCIHCIEMKVINRLNSPI